MVMPDYFCPARFSAIFGCSTYEVQSAYGIEAGYSNYLSRLMDHGFIADRACVWDKRLEGHEVAIVARTYCSDEEIDNPPPGLRCVRLPDRVKGSKEPGTAIAVVVTGKSKVAEDVLTACTSMPADMISHALPLAMLHAGYRIALDMGENWIFPVVRIVKLG